MSTNAVFNPSGTVGDPPALSAAARRIGQAQAHPADDNREMPGMTYREWLVGQALAGLLASNWTVGDSLGESAVVSADATLEALARRQ